MQSSCAAGASIVAPVETLQSAIDTALMCCWSYILPAAAGSVDWQRKRMHLIDIGGCVRPEFWSDARKAPLIRPSATFSPLCGEKGLLAGGGVQPNKKAEACASAFSFVEWWSGGGSNP
ncbi:MAG: hypothetical protein HOP03_11065 [Lysobacter sp.]|nr:hypothetical protein [Lysobacter sp.]